MLGLFEKLIGKPVYLLDLLPERVEEGSRGQYGAVEAYWRTGGEDRPFCRRLAGLLLRLNCYYDFDVNTARYGVPSELPGAPEHWERNMEPEALVRLVVSCACDTPKGWINIVLDDGAAMVVLDGDDQYASVYGPDETLRERLERLAGAEGLFFRPAPESAGDAPPDGRGE